MNLLGFQPLTYLVQLGTMHTVVCVSKSNITFSREESQKIDYVLEIYHHCFFFNKVWESGYIFFFDCVMFMYNESVSSFIIKVHANPQLCYRNNTDPQKVIRKLKIFYWSNLENLRTDTSLVFINVVIFVGYSIEGLTGSGNTN